MTSLIHADVFFFTTTIIVVVVGIIGAVCLVYAVRIFKDVSEIAKRVREETDRVISDIGSLRSTVKEEGQKLSRIVEFVTHFVKPKKSRRVKKDIINDN